MVDLELGRLAAEELAGGDSLAEDLLTKYQYPRIPERICGMLRSFGLPVFCAN